MASDEQMARGNKRKNVMEYELDNFYQNHLMGKKGDDGSFVVCKQCEKRCILRTPFSCADWNRHLNEPKHLKSVTKAKVPRVTDHFNFCEGPAIVNFNATSGLDQATAVPCM